MKIYIVIIAILFAMPNMANAEESPELIAVVTCAAMTEALELPSAGWWRSVVTRTVGSSAKARQLIDEYAGIIVENIYNGNVGQKEIDEAMRGCKEAKGNG
jgi:hypothetical protein